MPRLLTTMQITPEAIQVLKSHGIDSVDALAIANVSELQNLFIAAAREGAYSEKYPSVVKIAAWVEQARMLLGQSEAKGLKADLDNIPTAVVKRNEVRERETRPRVPRNQMELKAPRFARHPKDPNAPQTKAPTRGVEATPRRVAPPESIHRELNPQGPTHLHDRRQPVSDRAASADETVEVTNEESDAVPFRTFDDYKQGKVKVRPLDRRSVKSGEDLEKSTDLEQENFETGKIEKLRMPRTRIRGVLFPRPLQAYTAAFVTVTAVALWIATAILCFIVPFYLDEYRIPLLAVPAAAALFAIAYVLFATGIRCRVCGCHLFYSRRCFKNERAHKLFGGFPLLSQALHMLIFRWFRCMYCGTALRLKKDP